MEEQKQLSTTSRVIKIDSTKSWEFFNNQARKLGFSVVIHFTTTWCMPSLAMNPVFEELALGYLDTLFFLVDVDDLMVVAKKMEIKAIPTFVMMEDGAPVDRLVGANPYEITKRVGRFARPSPIVHID